MAKVDDELDLDVKGGGKSGGSSTKKIIIFSLLGILIIGLAVTTTLLLTGALGDKTEADVEVEGTENQSKMGDKKASKPKKTAFYLDLAPPFVVNLNDDSGVRFLQVSVSVMSYDNANLEKVQENLPLIRHHLVLLFGNQKSETIKTKEGKEKLQADALKTIQDALTEVTGEPLIDAVYLPSIVSQ